MISSKLKELLKEKNSHEYNCIKAAEECNELAHALICVYTKPSKKHEEKIVEELGDLMIRLQPIIKHVGWQAIQRRVDAKSEDIITEFKKRKKNC